MTQVQIDLPAPDFSSEDMNGVLFRLSDLKWRKNVLLVLNRGFV